MPLYEYQCAECGERIEKMRNVSDRANGPECPSCGETTALALSVPGRAAVSSGSSLPTLNTGGGGCGCGSCGCGVNLN